MHTIINPDTGHHASERETGHVIQTLSGHPLFAVLPAQDLAQLAEKSQIHTAHKDQVIFLQDEDAHRVYFIKSGWVKLFRETPEGDEAVIDVISSGYLFGETAVFNDKKYPYSAQMTEAGSYISIPLLGFEHLMLTSPHFSREMMRVMAKFRRHQDQELEHRTLQNTAQRIGCFILRLCKPDMKGPQFIELPYDKTLIAAKLGMQPETFSRGLSRLREDTPIKIQGSIVEVPDVLTLQHYCCHLCSHTYPCKDLI